MDIRQATGDKARLNPPNQLCFTVLATLPLYIAYRSPYIFARSTCVQRRRLLHIHAHDISLRSYECAHFRLGYVHGCVKRKHRGGWEGREPISTRHGVPLLYGVADSERSIFTRVAPENQKFYSHRDASERIIVDDHIVTWHAEISPHGRR